MADQQHAVPYLSLCAMSRRSSRPCRLTSSAVVGSSAMHELGSAEGDADADPLAHAAAELVGERSCRWPRVGEAERGERLLGPPCADAVPRSCTRRASTSWRRSAHRVERRERVLEDDADVLAADGAQVGLVGAWQVLAVEHDGSAADVDVLRQEAQDRQADGGLAAAGLADDGSHLAAPDCERDVLDERLGGVSGRWRTSRSRPRCRGARRRGQRGRRRGIGAHSWADRGSRRSRT